MANGSFGGYSKVHPTTGDTPHDVRVCEAAGQVTLVCFTCETYQTVDSVASGIGVIAKGNKGGIS